MDSFKWQTVFVDSIELMYNCEIMSSHYSEKICFIALKRSDSEDRTDFGVEDCKFP